MAVLWTGMVNAPLHPFLTALSACVSALSRNSVFVRHALPEGRMTYRGRTIDLSSIRHVALMTVEGEKDDISGVGQTEAAHRLCSQIPNSMRVHYVQPKVGHYGVFNGSRFTAEIAPRIQAFIHDQDLNRGQWDRDRALRQLAPVCA